MERRGIHFDEKLSKEWLILEQCALLLDPNTPKEPLVELLSEGSVDWGNLIQQALRHNILPFIAYILGSNNLMKNVPHEFQELFCTALSVNRHVYTMGYRELARIVEAFDQQSLLFAITKGYTFDSTIYRSTRARKTNDIDILLLPTDKKKAFEILKSLGYKEGHFDAVSSSIVDTPQEMMKLYALSAEFAPEFVTHLSDPIVQSMCVDITCSLTWLNSPFTIAVADALQERRRLPIPGHEHINMPCLNLEYQMIYTALHLFKEAWVEMYGIRDGNNVNLAKFMDILYLCMHHKESIRNSNLKALLIKHDITLPVLWVFKHTDRVFDLQLCEEFGFAEALPESWLSSWQTSSYQTSYWKGTMRERLQRKDRTTLFLRSQG